MVEGNIWSVDEVAAAGLLAALGLEATPERLEAAALHLARHRFDGCQWAAERLHGAIVERLEAASTEQFSYRDSDWSEGFRAAEHMVMTARPAALLDLDAPRPRSTGQVLRAMVRQARQAEPPLVVRAPA